jgi:hypothetical protein
VCVGFGGIFLFFIFWGAWGDLSERHYIKLLVNLEAHTDLTAEILYALCNKLKLFADEIGPPI